MSLMAQAAPTSRLTETLKVERIKPKLFLVVDIFVSIIFMATSITREKTMISIYNKLNKFTLINDYKKINFYVKLQILIFSILFPILIGISIRRGSFLNVVAPIIISVGPFARDYLTFTQFGNLMLILNEQYKTLEKNFEMMSFEDWNYDYHKLYIVAKMIDETFGLQILFNVIVRYVTQNRWLV